MPVLSYIASLPFDSMTIVSMPLGAPVIFRYTQMLSSPPDSGPDGPGCCRSDIIAAVALPPLSSNSRLKSEISKAPVPLSFVNTPSENGNFIKALLVISEHNSAFIIGGVIS